MPTEKVLVDYSSIPRDKLEAMLHGAIKVAEREEELKMAAEAKVLRLMELLEANWRIKRVGYATERQLKQWWENYKAMHKIDSFI